MPLHSRSSGHAAVVAARIGNEKRSKMDPEQSSFMFAVQTQDAYERLLRLLQTERARGTELLDDLCGFCWCEHERRLGEALAARGFPQQVDAVAFKAAQDEIARLQDHLLTTNQRAMKQINALTLSIQHPPEDLVEFYEPLQYFTERQRELVEDIIAYKLGQIENGQAPPGLLDKIRRKMFGFEEVSVEGEEDGSSSSDSDSEVGGGLRLRDLQRFNLELQEKLKAAQDEAKQAQVQATELQQANEKLRAEEAAASEQCLAAEQRRLEFEQRLEAFKDATLGLPQCEKGHTMHRQPCTTGDDGEGVDTFESDVREGQAPQRQRCAAEDDGKCDARVIGMRSGDERVGFNPNLPEVDRRAGFQSPSGSPSAAVADKQDQGRAVHSHSCMDGGDSSCDVCKRELHEGEECFHCADCGISLCKDCGEAARTRNKKSRHVQTDLESNSELANENKRLKVMLEEMKAKMGDMMKLAKARGFHGLLDQVCEDVGIKPLLQCGSVFEKLYQDAFDRVERLERLRERLRLQKHGALGDIIRECTQKGMPLPPNILEAVQHSGLYNQLVQASGGFKNLAAGASRAEMRAASPSPTSRGRQASPHGASSWREGALSAEPAQREQPPQSRQLGKTSSLPALGSQGPRGGAARGIEQSLRASFVLVGTKRKPGKSGGRFLLPPRPMDLR